MNNQIILVLCDSSTGFGQVSIFGSSSNTRPSTNGYDWFSTGAPNQFLIYPSESKYPITNLWVAVYGKQRSSFKISIRTPAENPSSVINGLVYSNTLRANTNNYNFYSLDSFTSSLPFMLELNSGGKNIRTYASFSSVRPNERSYQWTGINRLEIDPSSLQQGNLYLSYTADVNVAYSGIAYSGIHLQTLKNASAFDNTVYEYQYQYYYVTVIDLFSFAKISVKSSLGNNFVYASRLSTRPSSSFYTWRSATSYPQQNIDISPTDREYGVGPLYISVYGNTNARYSITATLIGA